MKSFGLVFVCLLMVVGGCATTSSGPGTKAENLYVEYDASEFFEIVAFAPGSGWIKIKTRDEISPILSFNHVTHEEIERFNRYAQSLGVPVMVGFADHILSLRMRDMGTSRFADASSKKRAGRLYWQKKEAPALVIQKGTNGTVSLVAKGRKESGDLRASMNSDGQDL